VSRLATTTGINRREVARLLAVLRGAQATQELPSRSLASLRVAEEAGTIEIDSGLVRFTHPLLASTVYGDTPAQERRSAHRRLAKVVADDEERVRHMALASQGPSEGVAIALEEAAQRAAARGAPDSAAELQALAVELTPPLAQTTHDERSIRAAEYRFSAGDARVARGRLEALIRSMPQGPSRALARQALCEMLWNDAYLSRKASCTVSIGPLRFLRTMSSATPSSFARSSGMARATMSIR